MINAGYLFYKRYYTTDEENKENKNNKNNSTDCFIVVLNMSLL